MLEWLACGSPRPRRLVLPPEEGTGEESEGGGGAEVEVDYAASLDNAATVIARLHRGQRRLVFVDSRSRAELLTSRLRELGVTSFVTHSSLGAEQRKQAEGAFASRDDCVIVATSVLELGVDIGRPGPGDPDRLSGHRLRVYAADGTHRAAAGE